MTAKYVVACASLGFIALGSTAARADIDVRVLSRALLHASAPAPATTPGGDALSAIIEFSDQDDGAGLGLPRIGSRFSAVKTNLGDLDALARLHPDWRVTWSAPLHPLLDHVAGWVRAPSFRNATGFTGQGVIVGIVDTGIDAAHLDFRNADGSTRIAYLVDFSGSPSTDPAWHNKDAEAQCTAVKMKCSVLSASDIDAANTASGGTGLPNDSVGHGTHVASLAAGNGGKEGKYVGIAPEATLIVVRAIDGAAGIDDAGVLLATNMIFSLAEREGQRIGKERLPAVVNLSLGSDWGPHDGSTALERGLADILGLGKSTGPEKPGRAVVVAAGNSAVLFQGSKTFPNPLGVHTDVDVPERSTVRVPIAVPPLPASAGNLNAKILVWIAFRPGDDVSVGLDRKGGRWVAPLSRGNSGAFGTKALTASIYNGVFDKVVSDDAAIVIDGTFPSDEEFAIELEGHGTASLWVQSEGDLGPEGGTFGAQFPGATKESTVTIPAASSALIAVGATLNRLSWTDRVGNAQRISAFGSVRNPPLDSIAYFSSAGPTTDMRLKPDLVAPGGFVAGAMSRAADPATNGLSVFAENAFCTPLADCIAVDDTHAITLGTSMASPIVAGAVALLFQGDPTLTENGIRTLLQAGARRPEGLVPLGAQVGAGGLDLEGILDVERQQKTPDAREPSAVESWLTLGATYAHPDTAFSVPAVLQLRDSNRRAANIDLRDLSITTDSGAVTTEPEQIAPGSVRFAVSAPHNSGGETLTVQVRYQGVLLAEQSLPIAVDVSVVRAGFWARGGCSVDVTDRTTSGDAGLRIGVLLASISTVRKRRARRYRKL